MLSPEALAFQEEHPTAAKAIRGISRCAGFVYRYRTTIVTVAATSILISAVEAKHRNRHADNDQDYEN